MLTENHAPNDRLYPSSAKYIHWVYQAHHKLMTPFFAEENNKCVPITGNLSNNFLGLELIDGGV